MRHAGRMVGRLRAEASRKRARRSGSRSRSCRAPGCGSRALFLKAVRRRHPERRLCPELSSEDESGRLAIDLINGDPSLREWVDNPAATAPAAARASRHGACGEARHGGTSHPDRQHRPCAALAGHRMHGGRLLAHRARRASGEHAGPPVVGCRSQRGANPASQPAHREGLRGLGASIRGVSRQASSARAGLGRDPGGS